MKANLSKRVKWIWTILLALACVFLIGLMFWLMQEGWAQWGWRGPSRWRQRDRSSGREALIQSVDVDASAIRDLRVWMEGGYWDLDILSGEQARVEVYSAGDLGEKPVRISVEDNTWNVEHAKKRPFWWFMSRGKRTGRVVVYLPDQSRLALEDVEAYTTGDLRMKQARALSGKLHLKNVFGNLVAGDMEAESIHLESDSGHIQAGTLAAREEVEVTNVSGDIEVTSLQGGFSLNNVSGDISLGAVLGEGKATNVSGNIELYVEEAREDMDLATVSGNVNVGLAPNLAMVLDTESVSGFRNIPTMAGGSYTLKIDTVSGDITVDAKP